MKKNATKTANPQPTTPTPPTETPKPEKKPDFYDRLLADTDAERAASILVSLCRRKDYAIRRILADHENGISFDEAAKALAEVYRPRNQEQPAN